MVSLKKLREKRTEKVSIRFSVKELREIEDHAEKDDLKPSSWIRRAALKSLYKRGLNE